MREDGPVRKDLGPDAAAAEAAAPYIGTGRVLLGRLKNLMKLGGLSQLSRTAYLEDGTAIMVSSVFGQDTIRITPAPATVAPQTSSVPVDTPYTPDLVTPEIPVAQDKCLLVVFHNNHVAAIPMSALSGPHWGVEYRAQLKKGALSPDAGRAVTIGQYNFGVTGCDSIFLAPFSLQVGEPLALDPNYFWLNAVRHSGNSDVQAVHAVQTGARWGYPICNASGATVYAPDGQYVVSKGVPALQQSYLSDFTFSIFDTSVPRAIGADGTYYFNASLVRPTLGDIFGAHIPGASVQFGGGALPNAVPSPPPPTGTTALVTASQMEYKGGTSTEIDTYGSVPGSGNGGSSCSLAAPFLVYQGGATDQLTMQSIQAMGAVNGTNVGFVATFDFSQSVGNLSESLHWTRTFNGSDPPVYTLQESGWSSVAYSTFPPALDTSRCYINAAGSNSSLTITPYFTSSEFGSYGWLHLSNGAHVMQGFFTQSDNPIDTPHLYLDGVDVQAKLEAALSTTALPVKLADIQAIVMDIPLALIQHLL